MILDISHDFKIYIPWFPHFSYAFQRPTTDPTEGLSEGNPETQRAFAVEGTVRPLLALLCHGSVKPLGKRMVFKAIATGDVYIIYCMVIVI